MEITSNATLSFYNNDGIPVFSAKQGDKNRKFVFSFSEEFSNSDSAVVNIVYPSGNYISQSCLIDVDESTISFNSTYDNESLLVETGRYNCEFVLNTGEITTWNFYIDVKECAISGKNFITALASDFIDNIQKVLDKYTNVISTIGTINDDADKAEASAKAAAASEKKAADSADSAADSATIASTKADESDASATAAANTAKAVEEDVGEIRTDVASFESDVNSVVGKVNEAFNNLFADNGDNDAILKFQDGSNWADGNLYTSSGIHYGRKSGETSGSGSSELGVDNIVTGKQSYALGNTNTVTSDTSVACGQNNTVKGNCSNSFGQSNTVSSTYSIVLGGAGNNLSSGSCVSCSGYSNNISANNSILAVGDGQTVTSGGYSALFGSGNKVSQASRVFEFGSGNTSTVSSVAIFGLGNTINTAPTGNQFKLVTGYFCSDGDYAFIIGDGTSSTPHNLFAIGWDGKVYVNDVDIIAKLSDYESRIAALESK